MGRLLNEDDVYALFASNGTARLHVADIDVLPRLDAVEVVHGRWEKVKQDLGDGIKTYRFGCSECGYLKNTLTGNYCPSCGAKMDLKD